MCVSVCVFVFVFVLVLVLVLVSLCGFEWMGGWVGGWVAGGRAGGRVARVRGRACVCAQAFALRPGVGLVTVCRSMIATLLKIHAVGPE